MTKTFASFVTGAALLMSTCVPAFAQEAFTIAGGGGAKNGSTYSDMLGTLAQYCTTDEMRIEEKQTTGGPENLTLLKGNKVKAALIPSDLLMAAKMENATSVATLQTLVALHMESAHVIARGDAKTEGGVNVFGKNLGGKDVVFNTAEDLKGRPIGAVGGSAVTARILGDLLKLGWKVELFNSNAELIDALTKYKIDAIVISAGVPSAAVQKIKGNFKLLPMRGNSDTSAVYAPSKLQYENLNSGRAVDSLAAQALLVTRTFRGEDMVQNLAKFRACFNANLGKIQDADGAHPAWAEVTADDHGKWAWYSLPNLSKPVAAPAPAPAAKKKG
jgi:TRAP-type uncharacterized transport system substrate-binding protein